uniref:Uncharacterized protein n=1 Tax=Myotis myotis TaxID=51298 RepID=A0A7J7ZX14_MYOMY|nr:hypothetical protein mMyoMyo1_009630 [Myotis myotis]
MSTFQRSRLGEGAGSCPSKLRTAGPSSACLQELERPQKRPGQCHRRAARCCQANVKSLPVAPSFWLCSAGLDRLRSLGFGDPLLKHSHRVPALLSPCLLLQPPPLAQGLGVGHCPKARASSGHRASGFELYWALADLGTRCFPEMHLGLCLNES